MKLLVTEKNPTHIKVNVFVDGALNGRLVFIPREWELFQKRLKPTEFTVEYISQPVCTVCKLRKKPVGRDAPAASANSLCDHECVGYYQDPQPGSEWD